MEALKLNDKVTVLVDTSGGHSEFLHATVTGIGPQRAVCLHDARERDFYLSDEGTRWARGWNGAAVDALTLSVVKRRADEKKAEEKRKRDQAAADRKRQQEDEDHAVERLQGAARIVKRAKVPRDLRETAFQYALMRGMAPIMWR